MKNLFFVLLIFVRVIASSSFCPSSLTFNVLSYGATGNGHTDDTQVYFFYFLSHTLLLFFSYTISDVICNSELYCKAFLKAWKDVCGATRNNVKLLIPDNKMFLLQPLSFKGPCNPATIEVLVNHKQLFKRNFCTYIYVIILFAL